MNQQAYDQTLGLRSFLQNFSMKLLGLLVQILFSNSIRVKLARVMGIRIGRQVYIGKYCLLDDTYPELITIEDDVVVSFGVTIVAHDASKEEVNPIKVCSGAFLGTRAVILPGVTIGRNAVVGAGAVVTRDIPAGATVAGVPARVIIKAIDS